jgi:RHS repeat-associated protein
MIALRIIVRVFDRQPFDRSGGIQLSVSAHEGDRRQTEGGAHRLEFQRGRQLHGIITAQRMAFSQPHGSVLNSSGNGNSVYGFTGEERDQSGLIFLRARYLRSDLGVFLSRDPWPGDQLRPGSMNGWNYVSSNPVNSTDPTGMQGPVVACQQNPQLCTALVEAVAAGTATVVSIVSAPATGAAIVTVAVVGGGLFVLYMLTSSVEYRTIWAPPPVRAPAPPQPKPTIHISPIPQPRTAEDIAREGGWTGRSPAPNPQREPTPDPNPEPQRGPRDPVPWITCTPTPTEEPEFIYRNGNRMKDLSLHRTRDWETGLSFSDRPPAGPYIRFRASILQGNGYVVRRDGGTIVVKLWGQGPYFDPTGQPATFPSGHITVYHGSREYWDAWHQADLANLNTPRVSAQIQALYGLREP